MDSGHVPDDDGGSDAYEEYTTEAYAELFAFLSLVDPNPAARADYGRRARTLLMHVIDRALPGPGKDDEPFRDPFFSTSDRSRWNGEAFALIVDWAYPYFSAADKARTTASLTRSSACSRRRVSDLAKARRCGNTSTRAVWNSGVSLAFLVCSIRGPASAALSDFVWPSLVRPSCA